LQGSEWASFAILCKEWRRVISNRNTIQTVNRESIDSIIVVEVDDPEEMLRRAEAAASKHGEKTASQKKADKNAAAARRKRETAAALSSQAARERDREQQLRVEVCRVHCAVAVVWRIALALSFAL
uniref:F-box domain-containing protein n=1 Tax=Anisakis simplex TaxID=6269 RepID=A0A0M3KHW5_ANISI